MKWTIL